MRTHIKLALLTGCLIFTLFTKKVVAQPDSIPNSGFENWQNMGTYEDPVEWGTLNSLTVFDYPVTVTKTTDAFSGASAIRLETKEIFTPFPDTVAGFAFIGSFNPFTGPTFGYPYEQRPAKLKGYYKFTPGPGTSDSCAIMLWLTKWDTVINAQQFIGSGEFIGKQSLGSYTLFEADIEYDPLLSSVNPDSLTILLIASASGDDQGEGGIPGSILYVDELSLEMPSGISEPLFRESNVVVYPNPASSKLIFKNVSDMEYEISVLDIHGRKLYNTTSHNKVFELDVSMFSDGMYFYEIIDAAGRILDKGKCIITK